MHIPDGFLDTKTIVASAAFAAVGVSVALSRSRTSLPPSRVPLLGMSAAFLFAAQMVNFPVIGGTSGHLVGSVLASVILGPSGAIIALTSVLAVQAFLFADGGILALGANVLNMAVAAPIVGYALYRAIAKFIPGTKGQLFAAGISSWVSIVVASLLCSGELSWSGAAHWNTVFPAMVGVHSLIGVGEAIITTLVLAAILRVRPDLLDWRHESHRSGYSAVAYGLVLACVVILFVVPFASPWPDGLEHVASKLGFSSRALLEPSVASPVSEYRLTGIGSPVLATIVAGLIGTFVVAVFSYVLASIIVSRGRSIHPTSTSSPS